MNASVTAGQAPAATTTRLALLGAGRWGTRLAAALGQIETATLVGVADPDAAAVRRICETAPSAVGADTLDELLAMGPDGVLVATPPELHATHARAILDAGRDLFVEKPLATRTADARELARRAESQGRVAMVGHLLRFHPAYERLERFVADGALGAPVSFVATRLTGSRSPSALWALAPHDLATLHALDPSDVVELAARPAPPSHALCAEGSPELAVELDLRLRSGLTAHLRLSTAATVPARGIVLTGSRQRVIIDELCVDGAFRHERVDPCLGASAEPPSEPPAPARGDALRAELEHFVRAVVERRVSRGSFAEGQWVVETIERAQALLDAQTTRPSARPTSAGPSGPRFAAGWTPAASQSPPGRISVIPPLR